ncbi:MAG TPA: UvrD-helicase domain-containing protein [Spirochaetia bacterium]|nr:UvrD-helicase domain-containing protein [Spirochaetia bacterium]
MSANQTAAYLRGLNPEQNEAVLHEGSPLLILAGAGSGKTRVITSKIAYLVDSRGVDPRTILAVTFTNKAASEMAERVAAMVPGAKGALIKTFHAFGAWLLRRYGAPVGLTPNFSIYDDDDATSLLSSLTDKIPRRELNRYSHMISRAKDYCLAPDDDLRTISSDPRLPELYASYERRLREIGNADFGDLILKSVQLLSQDEAVRSRIHDRFTIVLVDEYQDSNIAQYQLLKELSSPEGYLCVVGDDDQSIYSFRGAQVQNILTFKDIFPKTKVIRLEENYRSTKNILDIASAVVSNNSGRLGKTLRTSKPPGSPATLAYFAGHEQEAEFCAELLADGRRGETAILYRTNAQSLAFETLFTRRNIPYRLVGALRFYDREEIKDSLALLALLTNRRDEVAFRRIVNKPPRGIGAASVARVLELASNTKGDLLAASAMATGVLSKRAATGVEGFVRLMNLLGEQLESVPLYQFVQQAVTESGLLQYHKSQDEISGTQKTRNLDQLVSAAAEYGQGMEGLTLFLEHIELDRSQVAGEDDSSEDRVTLITMHNTKGLEFERVVITGLEDELFPGRHEEYADDIEEERRLFYVSITRAKKELYLTSCRTRLVWGRVMPMEPSRFLSEIPEELVEVRDGRFGSGAAGGEDSGYEPGQAVYHDEYGPGTIFKKWYNGRQLMVMVQFETGKIAQFFPKFQPLERISRDG